MLLGYNQCPFPVKYLNKYETDDADSMISFISSSFHKSIVQQLYFSLRNPEIAPIKSVVYSNIAKQYV